VRFIDNDPREIRVGANRLSARPIGASSRVIRSIVLYGVTRGISSLSRHPSIVRRMCLYRGVRPVLFDYTVFPAGEVGQEAVAALQRLGLVHSGERLILTRGDLLGVGGSTTTLKIIEL
jgi:pyruvate kinase